MRIQVPQKKIFWFIIYVFWILMDVEWVWDRSHLWCILGAVAGTICVYFAEFDSIPIGFAVGCISILIGAIVYAMAPPPAPEIGWLQPANEPAPANGCNRITRPPNSVLVIFGTNGYLSTSPETFEALKIGICPMIGVHVGPNGAQIDAMLNDESGTSLGAIIRNKYSVKSAEANLTVEKTGDLSTLIVHNAAGDELLWVKYINSNTFHIRGTFTCAQPRLISVIVTDENVSGPGNYHSRDNCARNAGNSGWEFE